MSDTDEKLTEFQRDVLLGGSDPSAQALGIRKPDYSQPPRTDGTQFEVQTSEDITGHLGRQVEPTIVTDPDSLKHSLPVSFPSVGSYVGQELDPEQVKLLVQPKSENSGNKLADHEVPSVELHSAAPVNDEVADSSSVNLDHLT